jgi:GT2 family glycosyltransferase
LDKDPNIGVVYGDWIFIDDLGNQISRFYTLEYDKHLLLKFNLVHCCFLFRREVMEKIGGYDPDYIYGEDWEFWIRASRYFRMKHLSEALYLYRIHSTSMTTELIQGTASPHLEYSEFAARMKCQFPFGWYYSKLKWKLKKIRLGYDPLEKWLK